MIDKNKILEIAQEEFEDDELGVNTAIEDAEEFDSLSFVSFKMKLEKSFGSLDAIDNIEETHSCSDIC